MMILSDRLELRPYRSEDVPSIQAVLYGDPKARRLTGGASTIDETRQTIARYIDMHARRGYAFWAVTERATGELVGEAGLKPYEGGGDEIELGYAFAARHWGRGLATEAGRAVLAEAFGPLKLSRVVAVTSDDNIASQHVLKKLEFVAGGRREVYGGDFLYYARDRHQ